MHTADSNILVFDAAARELGLPPGLLLHEVRSDLLLAAEQSGGLTPIIEKETASALLVLSRSADVVLLTCSTLGPVAAQLRGTSAAPVLRVDAVLAGQAVASGGKIVVLCAVETTVGPTTSLFEEVSEGSQASFEVQLVPEAWSRFKIGDQIGYLALIARAAESAYDDGASIVVLAQASMAGAAGLVKNGPRPLTSPSVGLAEAARIIRD